MSGKLRGQTALSMVAQYRFPSENLKDLTENFNCGQRIISTPTEVETE